MGAAINIATCVLLMAFSPTFAKIDCEKDVHENCPGTSLYETVRYDSEPFSEKFLEERCSDMLEDVTCKDDYLKTCDPDNYKLYSLLTNGVTNLITNLCNETSDLRKGFRQHVDCLQKKSNKLSSCIFFAMESAQSWKRTLHYGSGQYNTELQQIAKMCKFQEFFRSCTITVAKNYCGKDAGQYLSSVYEISIQDLVSEVC